MTDSEYMERALYLAEKGAGWVSPNPMVGAVIVKNGRIIAEGWHHCCGELHAERDALKNCREDPKGAAMYVTLEPCCHVGRQPPCVEAIVAAGIAKVVVGSPDPNPLVAGKGIAFLRSHGIQVEEGVCREACDRLNEVFLHYIRHKHPYVVLKYAMTLDGKIAAASGDSQWVTGPEARAHVQTLRNRYRAILVGVGTVLADNPMLSCRMEGGRNPIRIILDSHLRTPVNCRLVQTADQIPTVIATCRVNGFGPYVEAGCHVFTCKASDGQVDIQALLSALGENGVDSVLVEGGGSVHWSFLKAGLANKICAYVAPKLIGGAQAKTPIEGEGFSKMCEAVMLSKLKLTILGQDLLMESEVL